MTNPTTRRRFIGATAALGGAVAGLTNPTPAAADADARPPDGLGPVTVTPADPRYEDLAALGRNRRFATRPETFRVVGSTEQVVRAVGEAVAAGRRVTVRSGGHCYENFVGDPSVQTVIDLAELNAVYFDPGRQAFAVEAGARLTDIYRTLYFGWGVTLPGGASSSVAAGGHVPGGGYGALSRRFGLIVDHLLAVEVVVVDRAGKARAVVATRDAADPLHDLWWAHTGGGGGNFGIATRYWFRSPTAGGSDPSRLLPRPPESVLTGSAVFPREGMDAASFRRLVGNHGAWHERNSGPDSPYAGLYSGLVLFGRAPGADPGPSAIAFSHLDATRPDAERLLRDYTAALTEGVAAAPLVTPTEHLPWLSSVRALAAAQDTETGRQKIKSAYLRRRYSDAQIDTLHAYLDSSDHGSDSISVSLQSYGGRVNTVPPGATAAPQRDSVLKAVFMNTWQDPALDARNVDWLRRLYRDVYAETGGVPAPGPGSDGCFINFPDIDMADPEWNTSGVPWHDLYYRDNYPRLQRAKARFDPRDIFSHGLSVRAPR